jgi:hypothetical protein
MTRITFAVDGPEWDSLYLDSENEKSAHKIRDGISVQVQLVLWPGLILHHWNKSGSKHQLAYLGFDQTDKVPERNILSLKSHSNLYLISGVARRVAKHSWGTDPRKLRIDTLLGCVLPIVLQEDVAKNQSSSFVDREGDFLVAVCFLFGSIAFSDSMFHSPVVGKVARIAPLNIIPPATLVEVELQPGQVVPDLTISYDSEQSFSTDSDHKNPIGRIR